MTRDRRFIFILIGMLLILLYSTVSCITVSAPSAPQSKPPASQGSTPSAPAGSIPAAKPVITFTSTPLLVNPGQPAMLAWDVTNATEVSIQPNIGSVNLKGVKAVTPTATTTYMLVAKGGSGEVTSSVTVTVTSKVGGKPDLTVTDIWIDLQTVYYTVLNLGGDMPKGTRAVLWINGLEYASDYVEKLSAGERKTYYFGNYVWRYRFDSGPGQGPVSFLLKVCVDQENDLAEVDEGNNCLSRIYGNIFIYEFTNKAHMANWANSNTDVLNWPLIPGDPKGSAYVPFQSVQMEDGKMYYPAICLYPPAAAGSWIQGKFGEFYVDPGAMRSRPMLIPRGAKFSTLVGFLADAPVSEGASFTLSTINEAGSIIPFQTMPLKKDGKIKSYEVDLSGWEGKWVQFTLRVEARDAGSVDWVALIDPKIMQMP